MGHNMGTKGIGVTNEGTLEMHGKQFFPTWTRLAAPAYAGSNVIWLQEEVNWEVGQRVAIISSAYKDIPNDQNEVRIITAVSGRYAYRSL